MHTKKQTKTRHERVTNEHKSDSYLPPQLATAADADAAVDAATAIAPAVTT